MMEQITKSELQVLVENDDSIEFMGRLSILGESRVHYRTSLDAGDDPRGYKIVYVVD